MEREPAAAAPGLCHGCGEPVGADRQLLRGLRAELAPPSVSDGAGGGAAGCESCSVVAHQRRRLLRVLRPQGAVGPRSQRDRPRAGGRRDRPRPAASPQRGRDGAGHRGHRRRPGRGGGGLRRGLDLRPTPTRRRRRPRRRRCGCCSPRCGRGADLPAASPAAVAPPQKAVTGLAARPAARETRRRPPSSPRCVTGDARSPSAGSATAAPTGWPPAGPAAQQLTSDDSVAEELVATGLLSEAEALASPQAHVVTRWIGADLADAGSRTSCAFEPPGPGALLLCSDGLWNYQPSAAELAELALPAALDRPAGARPAPWSSFALDAGGSDNITVVLAPFPLAQPVAPDPAPRRSHLTRCRGELADEPARLHRRDLPERVPAGGRPRRQRRSSRSPTTGTAGAAAARRPRRRTAPRSSSSTAPGRWSTRTDQDRAGPGGHRGGDRRDPRRRRVRRDRRAPQARGRSSRADGTPGRR